MTRSLLIAGATGMVGAEVLKLAVSDQRFSRVVTWGRRSATGHEGRLEHWGSTSGDLVHQLRPDRMDAVVCCLGTTIKTVKGDKQAFIHVDKDLVVALGRWASRKNTRFCVVSAIGADPKSPFFYNRVKGEMEHDLRKLDFAALHIFQPSILDGPRTENRLGERAALAVMKLLRPVLPMRSHPMPHTMLAKALLSAATSETVGTQVHTYANIAALAREIRN
ncbi:MAG: hypothetical protein JNM62_01175 [Flavobacteriales bacterium]|nr:hypothetical protein [Flavobacteriales bacterium]